MGYKVMSILFSSNRIVEKSYKQKQYFSDKQSGMFKVKAYSGLLFFMVFLFAVNLYHSISQVAVVNTFF